MEAVLHEGRRPAPGQGAVRGRGRQRRTTPPTARRSSGSSRDLNTTLAAKDIDQIAASFRILDFQRAPVGTGPYKLVKYTTAQSVELGSPRRLLRRPRGRQGRPGQGLHPDHQGWRRGVGRPPEGRHQLADRDHLGRPRGAQGGPEPPDRRVRRLRLLLHRLQPARGPPLQRPEPAQGVLHVRRPRGHRGRGDRRPRRAGPGQHAAGVVGLQPERHPLHARRRGRQEAHRELRLDARVRRHLREGRQEARLRDVRPGRPRRSASPSASWPSDQLKKCGIGLSVKEGDFATVLLPLLSYPNDFDTYLGGWSTSIDPDDYSIFHSSKCTTKENPDDNNFVCWSNPEADKLLEDGRSGARPGKAQGHLREVPADRP